MSASLAEGLASPEAVRRLGHACLWAGILGVVAGFLLMIVPPSVPPERFSYPFDRDGFAAAQLVFAVQHLGLLAGILGLWAATRGSRLGRYGLVAALGGMLLLTATELVAIGAAGATYPSPETAPLDAAYGVSTLLTGAGLVAAGLVVARVGRWTGWRRWVALAAGVYVFVPMVPMLFGPFALARLAIMGWMALFAGLGAALAGRR